MIQFKNRFAPNFLNATKKPGTAKSVASPVAITPALKIDGLGREIGPEKACRLTHEAIVRKERGGHDLGAVVEEGDGYSGCQPNASEVISV